MQRGLFMPAALLLSSLLLTACGELSYKRGGGIQELGNAQRECQQAKADTAAYEPCMAAHGWVVQRLDAIDPVAAILPNPDNRLAVEAPKPSDSEAGNQPGNLAAAAASPLDTYLIGSWWKAGGNPENLRESMASCVERLGPQHRPTPSSQLATRGLLVCMRAQGWYGLQGK